MATIKPVIENEFLTEEDKRRLQKEVMDEVEEEARELQAAAYKAKLRKKLRQKADLEEPQEEIFIDLPESSTCIRIDGVAYMVNITYTVNRNKALAMREMMAKAWEHEAEINGKKKNFFKPRGTRLSMSTGTISNIPA